MTLKKQPEVSEKLGDPLQEGRPFYPGPCRDCELNHIPDEDYEIDDRQKIRKEDATKQKD